MAGNKAIVPQIQWHDGMALLPHHFQQMELRWSQMLAKHVHLAAANHWGIQGMVFDEVSLPDGLLRLLEADIVMPDGLIVHYSAKNGAQAPLEVDLNAHRKTSSREEILVQIAIPERMEGVSPLHSAEPRYKPLYGVFTTDENTDDHPVEIPRLEPQLKLLVGPRLPANHVGFPIAKIFFSDGAFRRGEYTPPCFHLEDDSPLWTHCRNTVRQIREKALALSEKWQNQMGTSLLRETEEMLKPLVTVLPPLEALLGSQQVGPFELVQTFLDAAGVIAQLDLSNVPPRFLTYDHTNIDGCLLPVLAYIEQSIEHLSTEYSIFTFKKNEKFFSLKLSSAYISSLRELIVGLRAKPGIQVPQIENWMRDAVIASDEALQKVQIKRITGAARKLIEGDQLYELSPPREMTLFSIALDPQFIFANQYLHIFNPSDTHFERPADIVLYLKKEATADVQEAA